MRPQTAPVVSRRAAGRAGFSLFEICLVLGGLTLAVSLGTALILGAFRVARSAGASAQRQTTLAWLADRFRSDVASATETPARLGPWTTGPACLALRAPNRHEVVYFRRADTLFRAERKGRADPWKESPVLPDCPSAEFARAGPDGRLVTLRLVPSTARARRNHPWEIAAALGGDLR